MKFSIITPTYKRPEQLIRAAKSLISQDYENWEMIIVNDTPPDSDYSLFDEFLEKEKGKIKDRIKYFKNGENKGVNYSRNFALKNISEDSDYFILLDDDDWLNEKTLSKAEEIIKKNPNKDWYVSNISYTNEKPLTKNKTKRNLISYLEDYLIKKRFSGDATHCISVKYKNISFSRLKNSEEWFFFVQLPENFLYYDFNSKYTLGYADEGITKTYKNKKEKLKNTLILFKESKSLKILKPKLFLYFFLRVFAIILK